MTMKPIIPDYSFKVLLIGDSSVGKTSLMLRLADNIFSENLKPTIGIDFKIKTIDVRGRAVKLQLWDTAGQEKFFNITRSYYRNADAILLVYDRTRASSFQNISRWMKNIEENAPDDVIRILVGNKSDLRHNFVISSEQGQTLASQYSVDFYETSAKLQNSSSVKEMFQRLAEQLVDKKENSSENLDPKKIHLDSTERSWSSSVSNLSQCCIAR